jgi:hypothetical protein
MPELVPTVGDAESKADLREVGWTYWPEDVLDALDLMLVHMGCHERLVRPAIVEPRKLGTDDIVLMRRAIPTKSLVAAARILYVRPIHPRTGGGRLHWYLPKKPRWQDRMNLAGVDTDTVQVVDRRRWAFCFKQLTDNWYCPSFSQDKQIDLINSEAPTPDLTPQNVRFTKLSYVARKRLTKKFREEALTTPPPQEQSFDHFGRRLDY